jgi:hypothetical protein
MPGRLEPWPDKPPGDLAVAGDDGPPLVDWNLGSLKNLVLPLAAQPACASGSEVTDPVRFTVWGNQIAALVDVDRG